MEQRNDSTIVKKDKNLPPPSGGRDDSLRSGNRQQIRPTTPGGNVQRDRTIDENLTATYWG